MSDTILLRSINISDRKGISKTPIEEAILREQHGIEGDSHAGPWHRQVSVLAEEEILAADQGRGIVDFGSFAENLTIRGTDITRAKILDRFVFGDASLEVTQIGKECHDTCAIGTALGECIMPKLGLFTRVLSGGDIRVGMEGQYIPRTYKALIITLSDRASQGIYIDLSGPAAKEVLEKFLSEWGYKYGVETLIIPDDAGVLRATLKAAEADGVDAVFTSGGTGIGPRDITPDVTSEFCDKLIPGVMEFIRSKYGVNHPNALVSRGVAGVKNKTLVYNLPGSPRAVGEYMNEILPTLRHSFYMLHGIDMH